MLTRIFTIVLLLCVSLAAHAELLVIVNAENSVKSLGRKQVIDLFMGRVTAFPNGRTAQTLDLPSGTPLRAAYYKALTGKSEAQIDAYWATLIFAGRMSPPTQYPSDTALINAVAANPSAIAYVPNQPLPPSVKVIMELPTQ